MGLRLFLRAVFRPVFLWTFGTTYVTGFVLADALDQYSVPFATFVISVFVMTAVYVFTRLGQMQAVIEDHEEEKDRD